MVNAVSMMVVVSHATVDNICVDGCWVFFPSFTVNPRFDVQKHSITVQSLEQWTCQACTLANCADLLSCVACNKIRKRRHMHFSFSEIVNQVLMFVFLFRFHTEMT